MPTSSQTMFLIIQALVGFMLLRRYRAVPQDARIARITCNIWITGCAIGILSPLVFRSWATASYGFPIIVVGVLTAAVAAIRGEDLRSLTT